MLSVVGCISNLETEVRELDKYGLIGDVKTLNEVVKHGDNEIIITSTFSKKGLLIEKNHVEKRGTKIKFQSNSNYQYGNKSQLISETEIIYSQGYLSYGSEKFSVTDYIYKDGILTKKITRTGKNSQLINSDTISETFHYNDIGILVKTVRDKDWEPTTEYFYDKKGKLLKTLSTELGMGYRGADLIRSTVYEYDEQGRLYKKSCPEGTNKEGYYSEIFDTMGKIVESYSDVYGSSTYKYSYDGIGNWLSSRQQHSDGSVTTINRKIEYFSSDANEKAKLVQSNDFKSDVFEFSHIRGLLISETQEGKIKETLGEPSDGYRPSDGTIYIYYWKVKHNGTHGHLVVFYSTRKHLVESIKFVKPGERIFLNQVESIASPLTK